MPAIPHTVRKRGARAGFADAAASRPACHVDTAWGIVALDGSFVAIVVEALDVAFPFVRLSRFADGIVAVVVGCTGAALLQGSGPARTSVDMEFDLVV